MHTFSYACPNCGNEIECDVEPEVPPRPCSDHDHPSFSDPGSIGSADAPDTCDQCGEPVDRKAVYEAGMQDIQDEYEAAMERDAEARMDFERERKWRD